jgi:hypothetical protein
MRPRKERQTQVDRRRIERIDCVGEIETQILVDVQPPRLGDQSLGQLRVNAPIARLVGIGQRRTPHRIAEAHGIEFRDLHRQAGFDVAQALPVGQLSERHGSIMLGTRQRPHPMVATVPRDNPGEPAPRQKIHQLGEKRLATVHRRLLGNLPEVPDRVQIDTTLNRQNCIQNHRVKGRRPGLNRTPVSLELIAGRLPRRALGLVLEWAELHQRELLDNWTLAQERKPIKNISPLE